MAHEFQQSGCLFVSQRFIIHCECHISSRLPPSGGTWKYAKAPITKKKKTWRDSLPIDMLLSAVSVLVVAQSISEIPEGLMNNRIVLLPVSLRVKYSFFLQTIIWNVQPKRPLRPRHSARPLLAICPYRFKC